MQHKGESKLCRSAWCAAAIALGWAWSAAWAAQQPEIAPASRKPGSEEHTARRL